MNITKMTANLSTGGGTRFFLVLVLFLAAGRSHLDSRLPGPSSAR
jgi:hypothetical protein